MEKDQSPQSWGPHGWKFLHYISLSYPENPTLKQKEDYRNFFISIKNVLPCHICSKHYEENIKKLPLTSDIMNDKNKLIKWVIDIHNIVNESKGKEKLSYEKAIKIINTDTKCNIDEHFINSDTKYNMGEYFTNLVKPEKSNSFFMLILILVGLITVAIVYKKK
jgi:hypothetical protein